MLKLLDTTYQLFHPDEADRLAAELNESAEDGWAYVVNHGTPYSFIEIYDEAGEFVARF